MCPRGSQCSWITLHWSLELINSNSVTTYSYRCNQWSTSSQSDEVWSRYWSSCFCRWGWVCLDSLFTFLKHKYNRFMLNPDLFSELDQKPTFNFKFKKCVRRFKSLIMWLTELTCRLWSKLSFIDMTEQKDIFIISLLHSLFCLDESVLSCQ